MNFGDIWEVFGITTTFNRWTIGLIIVYVLSLLGGYYLMASQVKLVKKEFWKWSDTLKSALFAFFFGNGITLIIATMFTFLIKLNDIPYQNQAIFLLLPILFGLVYVTIYPLIEFMFMAHFPQEIGTTPFQKPFERLIKHFKKPWSYVAAGVIYLVVMIMPPTLLILVGQVQFIIAWLSWLLIYPMVIILYYATIGYIIAFGIFTVSIPYLPRSTFLHFDRSKRAVKEFFRDPVTYISYFLLFYSYVYFFYKTILTFSRFSPESVTANPNYAMDWSIPISVVLAISAYFDRYWKRKVKSSTQSILFSTYLIAALCINIVTNYLIARPFYFQDVFESWDVTKVFYAYRTTNSAGIDVLLYTQLNLIGVIEEFMLFVLVTYFFFIQRDHKLIKTAYIGTTTSSVEKFNPNPGFNLLRFKDPKLRQVGYDALLKMYRRIPNKKGYNYNQDQFKLPMGDAISDRSHYHAYKSSQKLLRSIIEKHPKLMVDFIEDCLTSKNSDKILSILEVIRECPASVLSNIDESLFLKLLSPENLVHCKMTLEVLTQKYQYMAKNGDKANDSAEVDEKEAVHKPKLLEILYQLVDIPDYDVELAAITLMTQFSDDLDSDIFEARLNHPDPRIQSVIANLAGKSSVRNLDALSIPKLIEMADHVNLEIKAAVLATLAKIRGFEKNTVPLRLFQENLTHSNPAVRNAAVEGTKAYLAEKPYAMRTETLLKQIEAQSGDIQKSLVGILPSLWKQNPASIFPLLLRLLRSSDFEVSKLAQKTLIEMAKQDPKYIVSHLIEQEETTSILKRGKIADTSIKIALSFPKRIFPVVMKKLASENENARLNASSILAEITKTEIDHTSLKKIVDCYVKEPNEAIKAELTEVFQHYEESAPNSIKPYIDQIFQVFQSAKKPLKTKLAKMMAAIAEKNPELITFKEVGIMIKDPINSIREAGYSALGSMGFNDAKKTLKLLKKGLEDAEFGIRNESLKALANLAAKAEDTSIVVEITKLTKDKSKWTRKSAWDVMADLQKRDPSLIQSAQLLKDIDLQKEDPDVITSFLKWVAAVKDFEFDLIFSTMLQVMGHENEKVRTAAVSSLTRLSIQFDSELLVPKLLQYLSDESPILVEECAAQVLKKVVKYENKALKERVISLLSIRAHNTQNKILQQSLSELKN